MFECKERSRTTWGSHIFLLIPALTYSSGGILEIGVGHNSSIILNSFSVNGRRRYMMIEEDHAWLQEMRLILPPNEHREMICNAMDISTPYENDRWGLAFIDGPYLLNRRVDVIRGKVKDCAKYVVCHDSCGTGTHSVRRAIEENYKFYYHFEHAEPGTSIGSNFAPVDWVKAFTEPYQRDPRNE